MNGYAEVCPTWAVIVGLMAGGILVAGCQPATSNCPVTVPNGNTPPGEKSSPSYYGNGQLWTALWPESTVVFRPGGPGSTAPDGTLGMKWPWWRGLNGNLSIQGRRLDGEAPPLRAQIPNGYGVAGFQPTALLFPTEGCWEVTGQVDAASLTFVTRVVKLP